MAQSLVWRDLSADQLAALRKPPKGWAARTLLAKYMGLSDLSVPTQSILLDMYSYALQFGQEQQLGMDKLSCLVSILKTVHTRATSSRMTVDNAFALFKDLLLQHSVQRPPRSIGLFSLREFKAILDWGLDTYFRHYTLYQYAFTKRLVLSVEQRHPSDVVEVAAAQAPLLPLQEALTQEEHNEVVRKQEQQRTEQERAAAAAAEAAREAARIARLREEYEAAIPDEIRDRVQEEVDKQLAALREVMETKFAAQQQGLLDKVAQLEAKLSGA